MLRGHTNDLCALAWLPGSPLVISGNTDATLRLWAPAAPDGPTMAPHSPPHHPLMVAGMAYQWQARRWQ